MLLLPAVRNNLKDGYAHADSGRRNVPVRKAVSGAVHFLSLIHISGLSNEEVVNGCCERCGTEVTKKNLKQWMLKITAYADRLLEDLDKLDWPEKVKKMQSDWIGRSYGAEVDFKVDGTDKSITVYTTRPDTLHGATFMVLAPEHAMARELATEETKQAVEDYIYSCLLYTSIPVNARFFK